MAEMIATFSKGGVTPIEIGLQRTAAGVKVVVKTVPEVEAFMRDLGHGNTSDVALNGRYWRAVQKGQPIQAYSMTEPIDTSGGAIPYRLDLLGYPLNHDGYVNLSFLRLVGSSEGIGASFFLKGVYSLSGLRNMRDQLVPAAKQFYVDYMKPVDLIIKVSTQEVRY